LIFNAGNAPWIGIDWPAAIYAIITNFVKAVTYPRFKLQQVGVLSEEGFGHTWMCNVFGHFILVRELYYTQTPLPPHPYDRPEDSSQPLKIALGQRESSGQQA